MQQVTYAVLVVKNASIIINIHSFIHSSLVQSNPVQSSPVPSHPIPSHPILSHPILSYPRRVLAEAREYNGGEAFTLEYRRLPQSYRADSGEARNAVFRSAPLTRLVEHGGSTTPKCTVRTNASFFAAPCAADEPALLPPPPAWAQRLMIFWPNVILDEHTDGHSGYCFYE